MHQKLCATALNRSCSSSVLLSQPNLARARRPRSGPWTVETLAWKAFVEQCASAPSRTRPRRPSVSGQAKVERSVVELRRAERPLEEPDRDCRKLEPVRRILQALDLGALEAAQLARMLWLSYEVTRCALQQLEADGLVLRSETRAPWCRGRSGAPAFKWRLCAHDG